MEMTFDILYSEYDREQTEKFSQSWEGKLEWNFRNILVKFLKNSVKVR